MSVIVMYLSLFVTGPLQAKTCGSQPRQRRVCLPDFQNQRGLTRAFVSTYILLTLTAQSCFFVYVCMCLSVCVCVRVWPEFDRRKKSVCTGKPVNK